MALAAAIRRPPGTGSPLEEPPSRDAAVVSGRVQLGREAKPRGPGRSGTQPRQDHRDEHECERCYSEALAPSAPPASSSSPCTSSTQKLRGLSQGDASGLELGDGLAAGRLGALERSTLVGGAVHGVELLGGLCFDRECAAELRPRFIQLGTGGGRVAAGCVDLVGERADASDTLGDVRARGIETSLARAQTVLDALAQVLGPLSPCAPPLATRFAFSARSFALAAARWLGVDWLVISACGALDGSPDPPAPGRAPAMAGAPSAATMAAATAAVTNFLVVSLIVGTCCLLVTPRTEAGGFVAR